MKKLSLFILLLLSAFIICGCSGGSGGGTSGGSSGPRSGSGGAQTGNLKFNFTWPAQKSGAGDSKYISLSTNSLSISITGEGLTSAVTSTVTYGSNSVTIENLPVGGKTVTITALDSLGNVLSAGQQSFVIQGGMTVTTPVNLGVLITDDGFNPSTINVTQYTWIFFYNTGTRYHQLINSSLFPTDSIAPGGSRSYTVSAIGSYVYYLDSSTSGISGTIVVTQYAGPSISSFSPSSGALPGAALILYGTNFGASQGTGTVTIAGQTASITSWSDTTIICTVPSGAQGTSIPVYVTANSQSSTPRTYMNSAPAGTDVPTYIVSFGGSGIGNGQFDVVGQLTQYSGYIYAVDRNNRRVQKFISTTNPPAYDSKWGSLGVGDGNFDNPYGIGINSLGRVYVTDTNNSRVQVFDSSGNYITKWGSAGAGNSQFNAPMGVAIDSSDNVYVVDRLNQRIQKFDSSGTYITKWGRAGGDPPLPGYTQFNSPYGIAILGATSEVYVLDNNMNRVLKFDTNGSYIMTWGSTNGLPGSGNGQLNVFDPALEPGGNGASNLAVDPSDNVYVADINNNRIQKFSATGTYLGQFIVTGPFDAFDKPCTVYVSSDYTVYAADFSNRIKIFQYGGGK